MSQQSSGCPSVIFVDTVYSGNNTNYLKQCGSLKALQSDQILTLALSLNQSTVTSHISEKHYSFET